jgi:hypothetical protein
MVHTPRAQTTPSAQLRPPSAVYVVGLLTSPSAPVLLTPVVLPSWVMVIPLADAFTMPVAIREPAPVQVLPALLVVPQASFWEQQLLPSAA